MTTPDQRPLANNIILCGFMGAGKTTVGKLIAERLGWQFMDTDQVIEEQASQPISKIFAERGEAAFRQMEADVCERLAAVRHKVVATGGGIVLRAENREALTTAGLVVCLEAPPDEIARRLDGALDRPLLLGANPVQRIADLLVNREEAYAALPYHVNTAGRAPLDIAETVIGLWRQNPRV